MAMSKGMKWGLGIIAVLAVAAAVLYPRLVVSIAA
jgi:hypothetical protein